MIDAASEFRSRFDDVVLLAVAAAEHEGISIAAFMEREFDDAMSRLAEHGMIERDDDD